MMLQDITPIISVFIAFLAFYFARKKDTHEASTQNGKLISQLENISRDVEEMKDNVKEMRKEWHDDHDKIVSMERDIKAIWRNIDNMKGEKK